MVVKTVFFVSRGHFWRKKFLFRRIFKFFSCSQTLRKTFRIFGENNLVGLSKLFSKVQWIFLGDFLFQNQIRWLFPSFLVFGHILFGLSVNVLRKVCQNCNPCVQWRFLIGLFFLRKFMSFFTVFGLWGKDSGTLAQKSQKVCQKCNLCLQTNFAENLIFE